MHWQKVENTVPLSGGDPYTHLRLGEQLPRGFALAGEWLYRPLLLLLKDIDPLRLREHSGLRIPAFYTNPSFYFETATHCTALADKKSMKALMAETFDSQITVLPPINEASVPSELGPATILPDMTLFHEPPDPEKVFMGVIDDGLAFAHERFRLEIDKTRVEYMWVQDGPSSQEPGVGTTSTPNQMHVNPVPYGAEISAMEINRWLSCNQQIEDALYNRAAQVLGSNWLRSISRRAAHGTHVMDLACGYAMTCKDRIQRPIICVQLPQATTADTSGENLDAYLLDAIRYIVDRADALARKDGTAPLPVVINCSYGNVAGSHDGNSSIELAIDDLIRRRREAGMPPLEVVLPAGNSHLSRLHTSFSLPSKRTSGETEQSATNSGQQLRWRAHPDDRTPSFMEIWLKYKPDSDNGKVRLTIETPCRQKKALLDDAKNDAGLQLRNDDNDLLCEVRYRRTGTPSQWGMFLIALQPTKANSPSDTTSVTSPTAPAGTWIVTIDKIGTTSQTIEVETWIQRDDTPMGFRRRGRQSYYDAPCYQVVNPITGMLVDRDSDQPPNHVSRGGSMNAIATGSETIIIGGYRSKEGKPAPYSAGGPVASADRSGPDALAVSDRSHVLTGVFAAGTRSGSVVAMNGTSVAAPQIARLIAKEIVDAARRGEGTETGRNLVKTIAAEDELQLEEQEQNHDSLRPTCERGGAGRITRFRSDRMPRTHICKL